MRSVSRFASYHRRIKNEALKNEGIDRDLERGETSVVVVPVKMILSRHIRIQWFHRQSVAKFLGALIREVSQGSSFSEIRKIHISVGYGS